MWFTPIGAPPQLMFFRWISRVLQLKVMVINGDINAHYLDNAIALNLFFQGSNGDTQFRQPALWTRGTFDDDARQAPMFPNMAIFSGSIWAGGDERNAGFIIV